MMDYSKKIMVRLEDGSLVDLQKWQNIYGISGTKIGKHFSYMESRFLQDLQQYDYLEVNAPLMKVIDAYREAKGKPVNVNSYNRSEEYQLDLKRRGYKAATTSPHVEKLASDLDTVSEEETLKGVDLLKLISIQLDIPIRIGYRQYLDNDQTFIHVDVCPLYYGKGKVWHSAKHPAVWEDPRTW